VVKRGQKGGPFVDEFRMGHRANGVDDLPALGKRDGNFAFFKSKIYGRHGLPIANGQKTTIFATLLP
jgi:hypothetical protein